MSKSLSRRILGVKASPTVALNAKAKELKSQGKTVLNFAVGEPDFPTPQAIVSKAIDALNAGKTKYGPAGGSPALRQAITRKLKNENRLIFDPSQIVVGMGAKEILFHIFMSLLNDGDEVVIQAPYWVSYPDQITAAGGIANILPLPQDFEHASINFEALSRVNLAKTKAIVLNSPNNPAGYVYDPKTMKEMGEFLIKTDWWIISDEIYEYLAFDAPHKSLLELFPELKDRFIYVNGLSKGFAMTGWRVGYCAAPSAIAAMVRDLQSHSSTCLPPFIEEAATFAMEQGRALVEKDIQIFQRRRDLAVQKWHQISTLPFVAPQGAFYLFIDLRPILSQCAVTSKASSLAFCEYLLTEFGVVMVPGDAFGAPGFLRLSYAVSEELLESGLETLNAALKSYLK